MELENNSIFKSLGFRIHNVDSYIVVKWTKGGIILVGIYVDNFLLTAKDQKILNCIKKVLKEKYYVKDLGKMKMIIIW